MAYVTQEIITNARAAMKLLNKQYGVKATLAGVNTSSLRLKITAGDVDFISNYCKELNKNSRLTNVEEYIASANKSGYLQVNHYYLSSSFSGVALEYLEAAKKILMVDHWDESDSMTDYFHCAFYLNINIGAWDKPYVCTTSGV